MQMQDDDKIFKVLGDKLRDYEAGEASDADWAAFQAVYPAKKKKRGAFIWFLFPLLGVSFVLLAWYINLSFSEKSVAKNTQNNPNVVLSKPANSNPVVSSNVDDLSNPSSNRSNENSNETNNSLIKTNQTKSTKEKEENKNRISTYSNTKAPLATEQKSLSPSLIAIQTLITKENKLEREESKGQSATNGQSQSKGKSLLETKNENLLKEFSSVPKPEEVLNGLKANVKAELKDTLNNLLTTSNNLKENSDTVTSNLIKNKGKSIVQLSVKHVDLSAMYSPAMSIFNSTLASNNLAGLGLGIAFGISNHWYFGSGFNYMQSNSQTKIKKEVPHEYSIISKIDTNLKYDFSSSRIMMDIDTHFLNHKGTRIDEFSIVRNSQVFSIPFIIGYSLGNQKTELSLFSGVQNDWLVEEYTTNNLATKATETFTNQKLLAAPLVGFGFSRKFYANWALNLGMDYRHYLSSSLDQKDYWRVQAGIRYHLK